MGHHRQPQVPGARGSCSEAILSMSKLNVLQICQSYQNYQYCQDLSNLEHTCIENPLKNHWKTAYLKIKQICQK